MEALSLRVATFFMCVYLGNKYFDEIPLAISLLDNKGPRFLERNRAFNCLFLLKENLVFSMQKCNSLKNC